MLDAWDGRGKGANAVRINVVHADVFVLDKNFAFFELGDGDIGFVL